MTALTLVKLVRVVRNSASAVNVRRAVALMTAETVRAPVWLTWSQASAVKVLVPLLRRTTALAVRELEKVRLMTASAAKALTPDPAIQPLAANVLVWVRLIAALAVKVPIRVAWSQALAVNEPVPAFRTTASTVRLPA